MSGIKRELGIFLIVGSLTVFFDFLAYRSLLWLGWFSVDVAKAIGFIVGTIFAYFANRKWTFTTITKSQNLKSIWRFLLLYGLSLLMNVLVNAGVLVLLKDCFFALQIAFLSATCISAIFNFIGMKWFVFKEVR